MREAAHALKGVSGNIGATALAESSADVMRSNNSDLARNWQRGLAQLNGLLETAAAQAKREVTRLTSPARNVDDEHGDPP